VIRINLLPLREAQQAVGRRRQVALVILSILLALLMMTVPFSLQRRRLNQLDAEVATLQAEIAILNERAKEVRDLDKKRLDLEAKLKVITDLQQKRVGPLRVLEDLSAATPEKLWLVEFTDVGGAATLTGTALDNQTIATFLRRLLASNYFYEVDLVETTQADLARGGPIPPNGMSLKRFIIKARLDYLGQGGKATAPPSGAGATKTGA
jgi:type IV pilus assembly protein PilN